MVRASTRSKTAASTAASVAKQSTPKRKAVSPSNTRTAPTPKAKAPAKPKAPRKATRTSIRGKKDVEMEEQVEEEQEEEDVVTHDAEESQDVMADQPPDQPNPEHSATPEEVPVHVDIPKSPSHPEEEIVSTYCLCNGQDDGSPMITCEACENWCAVVYIMPLSLAHLPFTFLQRYHFHCVSLTQEEADDIGAFLLLASVLDLTYLTLYSDVYLPFVPRVYRKIHYQ